MPAPHSHHIPEHVHGPQVQLGVRPFSSLAGEGPGHCSSEPHGFASPNCPGVPFFSGQNRWSRHSGGVCALGFPERLKASPLRSLPPQPQKALAPSWLLGSSTALRISKGLAEGGWLPLRRLPTDLAATPLVLPPRLF